ncbi:hypothetical protein ABKV19_006041 [Rosa sericea]
MALRQRKSKRNLSLCNKEIANHPSVSVTTQSNLPNSRSRRCTQRISDNSAIEDASTSISMSAEHSVQDITVFDTSQLRRSKRRRVLQKDTPTVTNSGQASYQRSREGSGNLMFRSHFQKQHQRFFFFFVCKYRDIAAIKLYYCYKYMLCFLLFIITDHYTKILKTNDQWTYGETYGIMFRSSRTIQFNGLVV